MSGIKVRFATAMLLISAMSLAGCSTIGDLFQSGPAVPRGKPGSVQGFLGGVVADEPQAALIGRNVLSAGGNAADAATAMGFALAVTLPSRAGLGSSGACLVYDPARSGPGGGAPEAVVFPAVAPANPGAASRPASVPMLARGLYAMQARYGSLPVEQLIVPAEQAARFGVPVSRALLRDLSVVAGPLSADPGARAVFFPNGTPLADGAQLLQPELGGTIAQLRVAGLGDLYQGVTARKLEQAMPAVGGGLAVSDMRNALPHFAAPYTQAAPGNDVAAVLPAPEAGGIATLAALNVLAAGLSDPNAQVPAAEQRSIGVAAAMRQGGAQPEALLKGDVPVANLGPLPASTSFGAVDRDGRAVMCATSMGNLFGTGRIAPGTGILLGVSPAKAPPPLLAVTMLYNPGAGQFHGMAGGSGQEAAPIAAAVGLVAGLLGRLPATPPEPGRANVIACPEFLPKRPQSCIWAADPRGLGLAIGGN
jgi:gamma-glutamyltranspeptidase/glutathione hydrolase